MSSINSRGAARNARAQRKYPHLLVMTATPIPRTLGLTLYVTWMFSTISEMPAGRGKIKTFVRMVDKLPKVFAVHPRKNFRRAAGLCRLFRASKIRARRIESGRDGI